MHLYAQNMQKYARYVSMKFICNICKNMHSPESPLSWWKPEGNDSDCGLWPGLSWGSSWLGLARPGCVTRTRTPVTRNAMTRTAAAAGLGPCPTPGRIRFRAPWPSHATVGVKHCLQVSKLAAAAVDCVGAVEDSESCMSVRNHVCPLPVWRRSVMNCGEGFLVRCTTRDAGDPGSNPALGNQRSLNY